MVHRADSCTTNKQTEVDEIHLFKNSSRVKTTTDKTYWRPYEHLRRTKKEQIPKCALNYRPCGRS
jgi:hypothetical protein